MPDRAGKSRIKPEHASAVDTRRARRVHGIPPDEAIAFWRLRNLLSYDPDTGEFTWLSAPSRRVKPGRRAGYVNGRGYVSIAVEGRLYLAHRLAWFWMTGEWPHAYIDHIDCDTLNNRWNNLREATYSQSATNQRISRVNKSGLKGVSRQQRGKKWKAQVTFKGKTYYLGLFDSKEEAHAAYKYAAKKLHGDYARAA